MYLAGKRFAAPHYRGPRSDHFDGERFYNRIGRPVGFRAFLRWMATRQPGVWPAWIDGAAGRRPPERVTSGIRATFVNHATILLQTAGVNVLTDPMWSERASPVQFAGPRRHRAPGIDFDDLPPIDVVLISHNHYDHLDLPTLRRLAERHRPLILTPLGSRLLLEQEGIDGGVDIDWWEERTISRDMRITSVPAEHFSGRGIGDRDRTLWCGYVVGTPHGQLYFAGDTGYGPHFQEIASRFSPIRLAMLPIGAFMPVWFMSPVHIEPADTVRAHVALKAEITMPMHFGTFALGDDGYADPLNALSEALRDSGLREGEFRVVAEGEALLIDQ